MAKKDIARTAIEGGRVASNKQERWRSNRYMRNDTRQLMRRITKEPDLADDIDMPSRRPLEKDFTDKLSAPMRWLAKAAIGKTAEEIRGLLLKRFDTRTLAGRHLVFDHLMPRHSLCVVEARIHLGYVRYGFDGNGVLRKDAPAHVFTEPKIRFQAREWRGGLDPRLRIGRRNQGYFWFVPQKEKQQTPCTHRWCKNQARHPHRWNGIAWVREPFHVVPAYHQDRELTPGEERLFLALHRWTQDTLDVDEQP